MDPDDGLVTTASKMVEWYHSYKSIIIENLEVQDYTDVMPQYIGLTVVLSLIRDVLPGSEAFAAEEFNHLETMFKVSEDGESMEYIKGGGAYIMLPFLPN